MIGLAELNKRNFFLILAMMLIVGCQGLVPNTVQLDISQKPFERLSQYQFFVGEMSNLEPSDGVLPYDLNSPLFTDYADKSRFVWMPEGTAATYREDRAFDFPAGAVLIKNFF